MPDCANASDRDTFNELKRYIKPRGYGRTESPTQTTLTLAPTTRMPRPFTRSQAPKPNASVQVVSVPRSSPNLVQYSGKVTERLPSEIICLICQAIAESPPDGRALVLHIHHTIRSILQIKNTCKSWYLRISTAKLLFREIAFDTTNASTLESAQVCLRLLGKKSKIPLRVFIAGSKGDMDKYTRAQGRTVDLLKRLSGFGPNIARCQVWDPSDSMCNLLRGHASTLEYLSIGVMGGTSVFSGPLPNLRSMVITTSNAKLWRASALPALSRLNLAYASGPTGPSLRALIDLLRGLPQLQDLHLDNFQHWIAGNNFLPRAGPATIPLRTLYFTNCDFPLVLQCLRTPNLRSLRIYGARPDRDVIPLPFFRDPGLMSRVQTTPILGSQGMRRISIITRQEPTMRSLAIEILGKGLQFSAHLDWFRWRQSDWERWVDNSWRDLCQRAQLSSRISLAVDFAGLSPGALYPTLLSAPCVEALIVVQGSLHEILQHLAGFDQYSNRLRLPVLKILDLTAYASISVQQGNQVRAYLQFRAESNAPVKVTVENSAWSEARGFPWTSFMIANSTKTTTTLSLRQ
jgi:hypothetical protein